MRKILLLLPFLVSCIFSKEDDAKYKQFENYQIMQGVVMPIGTIVPNAVRTLCIGGGCTQSVIRIGQGMSGQNVPGGRIITDATQGTCLNCGAAAATTTTYKPGNSPIIKTYLNGQQVTGPKVRIGTEGPAMTNATKASAQ